jgi:hypothetical protein
VHLLFDEYFDLYLSLVLLQVHEGGVACSNIGGTPGNQRVSSTEDQAYWRLWTAFAGAA